MEGIRDRLYGFVKFCPKQVEGNEKGEVKTDMAMDISFGSSGYALVLARAFRTVRQFFCINICTWCSCLPTTTYAISVVGVLLTIHVDIHACK